MNKIALFGATGRLGRAIAALSCEQSSLQISEAIAHPNSPFLGQPLFTGGPIVSASFQNLSDLAIDVSTKEADLTSLQAQIPLVLGTTGLSPEQMHRIESASKTIPLFYSPNFSLGMALFRRLCMDAARKFPACTADLFEAHHAQKKDSPGGSALLLSKDLEQSGKRTSIHSIRSGQIVGEHKLLLNTNEERIELSHTAHSRMAFARGALEAARFLLRQKKPGLYSMDDLGL